MATLADVPEFFSRPLGADYPKELGEQLKRTRACTIKIEGNAKTISATQPWLDVQFDKTHVIFPATRAAFKLVLRGDSRETDNIIQTHQNSAPQLKKDYQPCFFQLSLSADPVFAGPFWKLNEDLSARWKSLQAVKWNGKTAAIWIEIPNKCLGEFRTMQTHIARLVELVRTNLRPNNPQCGLWYAERNPLPEGVKVPRRPKAPWLFDRDGNYHTRTAPLNFFLDEQDRRSRLVEAAIIEQHIEWATYDKVFCNETTHAVIFEQAGPTEAYWQLHVWMSADPKPNPPEGIKVNYKVNTAGPGESSTDRVVTGDGICIQSSRADFTILTRAHFGSAMDGQMRKINATVTANLKSTTRQINALDLAGRIVTFGDLDTTEGHGYSLERTILAHGSELSPESELYFELDVREVSVLDQKLKDERLDYIEKKFKLDNSQRQAVNKSVFQVVAGIHLVKGPPGNGKTRTTVVMILILACLGMKVLISAGSNRAVDTLLLAYHEALKEDQRLQEWCGGYCRFRTPAYQMAVLRRSSKFRQISSVEKALADCQTEALVVQMATDNYHREPEAKKLLDMLDEDRQRILSTEEMLVLTGCYEEMLRCALGRCMVVAATLNASGDTNLQMAFKPYALFCNEAGQCLEGDSMIPMTTFLSLRTIILIGDPKQLSPTVLSKGENEGANYQGKSLMSRLSDLYPLTLLEVDGTQKPKGIVSLAASSKRKAPSSPQSAAPPRKAFPVTRPPASPRNVEQSGAVGIAPDSKVIGGEVVKITSSLEQLKLDREALEAEQVASNERWAMLVAMMAKLNADQDDLRARRAKVDAAIANLELGHNLD
ncbi:unnamed protein product [Penicillium bialowiezense]